VVTSTPITNHANIPDNPIDSKELEIPDIVKTKTYKYREYASNATPAVRRRNETP
jgi:hypothetical protein